MSRPRLTISPNRVFFGVCGGVAEYFGWEAYRVRTAAVIIAIFTAVLPAVAIYAMLYYMMPDNDF